MGNWSKQARAALAKKNFTQAGDFFKLDADYKAAIKAYTKGGNHSLAACIYEDMGNLKKAEQLLIKKGTPKALGEFYLRNGSPEKAASVFLENGLEYEAAELVEKLGQFAEAAALYERLHFHEKAGLLYGKTKNFDKAIDMFSKVVKKLTMDGSPAAKAKIVKYKDWIANFHIGAKRFNKAGEVFEAINQKEKAAKCFAKGGSPLKAAGLLLDIGRVAEAEKTLAKVESREARVMLGKIAMDSGKYEKAVSLLADTDQYKDLTEAYDRLGRFQEAAFYCEKAGDLKKAAEMYSRGGDYQKAAILFEQNGYYEEAAQNYELQEKFTHAAKFYHLAKNRFKAGYCLFKIDRLEDALKQLQCLEPTHKDHTEAKTIMAKIFFKQRDFSVARKLLEELTKEAVLDELSMPQFYMLARCMEEGGDLVGAKRYYERLVARRFDFMDVRKRLKRLERSSPPSDSLPTMTANYTVSPLEVGVGDTIDNRFRILSVIGKGGMGSIFKVRDQSLDRDIALKMLIHESGDFEELKVELLIARDLTHPYIIKVFDVGIWQSIGYFTMEHVAGQSLKAYILNNKTDPLPSRVQLLIKICQGLREAHKQDVVHRDIKPQNIMIDENFNPKILDFGIARRVTQGSQKSSISGSPKYMAPEQIQNLVTDPRTDIYAMGIIMFYMFTRKEPFVARTPQEVMLKHLETPLPDPMEFNPALPYWMSEIIKKCCEKNPEMRFSGMDELIRELKNNLMDTDYATGTSLLP